MEIIIIIITGIMIYIYYMKRTYTGPLCPFFFAGSSVKNSCSISYADVTVPFLVKKQPPPPCSPQ